MEMMEMESLEMTRYDTQWKFASIYAKINYFVRRHGEPRVKSYALLPEICKCVIYTQTNIRRVYFSVNLMVDIEQRLLLLAEQSIPIHRMRSEFC